MSAFARALAGGLEAIRRTGGKAVTYCRGGAKIEGLRAFVTRADTVSQNANGVLQTAQTRDYIVAASDLVLGGVQITPEPGDLIREVVGDETISCRVVNADDEKCFRESDPEATTLRIHTKQVR